MDGLIEVLQNLFTDYTLRTVALGSATLGLVSGALGVYALLRKQSLLGDAMSHAALPGVVLAFLIFRTKAPVVLIIGATVAGWLGTLVIVAVVNHSRIKMDSAMGLVLSVFFGLGMILLTYLQRIPDASQAGLNQFLFGQAATLLERDVVAMTAVGGIALILVMIFWKEFKLLSFDPDFGASMGFPMTVIEVLLTTLIVIAIVIGLQAVGVVLMSAMIVAPAAAARQWTNRMGVMVGLSALFGALAGVVGTVISSLAGNLSTGPVIVLSVSAIVVISLLFATKRGLVWRWIQSFRRRRNLELNTILLDLYILAEKHEDRKHAHDKAVLKTMRAGHMALDKGLKELVDRGYVRKEKSNSWRLTEAGWNHVKELSKLRGERA